LSPVARIATSRAAAPGVGDLFGATAAWPEGTDTVRVINNEKSILGKDGIEPVDERAKALSGV
jgi:hypothetical protein